MKEAWSSNDKGILRTRNHSARWRLLVHKPASVFRARIANTPTTWPASAINVDNVAGTISDALAGYTARLGTSDGGSGLGKIRIRRDGSGSTLQIAEAGCALLDIREGHYVTVYKKREPWTKHYRKADPDDPDNHDFIIDYDEGYTSQLEIYSPLVIMGPPLVVVASDFGTDSSPTTQEASFIGASTQFIGGSFATASWATPTGTLVNESSKLGTAGDPTVYSFAEGQELPDGDYFSLTATDASGASHAGYRPMWFINNASQAKRVEFGRIEGGIEDGGYEVELRVLSPGGIYDTEEFPDGAEIVIFEEASFGNTASNIGGNYPFRSNVVFRGWIVEDTITLNPFHSEVTFRARTINGLLENAAAYDTFLADYKDGTSAWTEASGLTPDRMAWYLVRHRATVGDIVDVNLGSNLSTCRITYQDLGKGFFWDQLRANYGEKGHLGFVAADMQSNLFAFEDVQITGGSGDIPMTYNIEKQDRRDAVMISHPVQNTISRTILMSVASNTNSDASNLLPVGAESPGSVIGYFGGETEHTKGLYVDQDTLIQWAGNWRAKMNNPHPQTLVPLAGNYRLDPVPLCRVTLPLAASDNARGLSWYDENETLPSGASVSYFLPKRLGLEYNSRAGIVLSDVELEKVTHGIGGSSITFPSVSSVDTGDAPDPVDEPGDDDITTQGDGFGTFYTLRDDELYRTRDLSASSPSFTQIFTETNLSDFILDPWSPSTTGYVLSSDGDVYKSTDLDVASPTFNQVLTEAQAVSGFDAVDGSFGTVNIHSVYKMSGSINLEGFICYAAHLDNGGAGANDESFGLAYSTDGGDNWSFTMPSSGAIISNMIYRGAVEVWPRLLANGEIKIFMSRRNGDSPDSADTFVSEDSGQSFTLNEEPTAYFLTGLHSPYDSNPNGDILYSVDYNNNIVKSTDGGQSWTSIATLVNGNDIVRGGVETYTQNANRVFYWDGGDFYLSTNGGDSFTNTGSLPAGVAVASGGFPYDNGQFYALASNGNLYVSTNSGATWTDKTGDLPAPSATPDGLTSVVVPLWIAE